VGVQHFDAIIVGAGFGNRRGDPTQPPAMTTSASSIARTTSWHVACQSLSGLSVDQPSPTFAYWFEANPFWSRCMRRRTEATPSMWPINTTCAASCGSAPSWRARWDDDARVWRVALAGGETLSAQFLIAATGFLCQARTPDIPGIDTFAGRIIHTAAWDDSYSLTGRRAAVIGTGSTGVQVVPELAKEVSELTVYQRTPIWVLPKLDVVFPAVVQRLFARLPLTQRILRWFTDTSLEFMMVITMWKYRYFKLVNKAISGVSKLYRLLLVRDKELSRNLNPDFDFGCKRPTISNSYYPAFSKPHVQLETSGIERIEPDGIVARDGTKRSSTPWSSRPVSTCGTPIYRRSR
jgi:cation diffusion facilitator CzcD-associated flavoprotein CzcO